jgi:hypothetical protein
MINTQFTKLLLIFPHPKEVRIDRQFEEDMVKISAFLNLSNISISNNHRAKFNLSKERRLFVSRLARIFGYQNLISNETQTNRITCIKVILKPGMN